MNYKDSAGRPHSRDAEFRPMGQMGQDQLVRPHSDEARPHSNEERPHSDEERPLGDELAFDRPASDAMFDLMNRPNGDASLNYLDSGRQCAYEKLSVCYS